MVTGLDAMRTLDIGERHALAISEDHTFIALFRGHCRTSDVRAMKVRLDAWIAARAGVASFVIVVIAEGSSLGPNGRAEITGMFRRHSANLKGWANVIDGVGFWSSAVRAITATLSRFARHDFPLKIFGDVRQAAEWLASLHTHGFRSLASDVEGLKSQVQAAVLPAASP